MIKIHTGSGKNIIQRSTAKNANKGILKTLSQNAVRSTEPEKSNGKKDNMVY